MKRIILIPLLLGLWSCGETPSSRVSTEAQTQELKKGDLVVHKLTGDTLMVTQNLFHDVKVRSKDYKEFTVIKEEIDKL